MSATITYHWGKDHLLIDLGKRTEPRVRMLFLAEFLVTAGFASILLMQALSGTAGWIVPASAIGATGLYTFAVWRFLCRGMYREYLLLDQHTLSILQKGFLMRKLRRFSWAEAGPLRYKAREQKTDHPLKGRHYDYWGFDRHEHLVQYLHQEGNLAFESRGGEVRFGKGLYLWHAEELVQMMQLYAGEAMKLGQEWKAILESKDN